MKPRSLIASLLLGVLVTLAPLAFAGPPDPTWIAGLYDDADYDDVVLIVTAGAEVVETRPPLDLGMPLKAIEFVPPQDDSRPAPLPLSSNSARAPPAA
jgi:hypothetical protein